MTAEQETDHQTVYRFRWTNVEMKDFVRGRRSAAENLRREASVLMRRAEQIEEETAVWENALEEVDAS